MNFKEKYTIKNEPNKITVSNDAYCIGEAISDLIDKLEKIRIRWPGH